MCDSNYLIIAGTSKAGSTSLFYYLADHPEVCATEIKETRFFLDPDYPEATRLRNVVGLYQYEDYFDKCGDESVFLEASPQYLYSVGTPQRILNTLPNARLIFILRNPADRLISFYKFAKQRTMISNDMSLTDYVYSQLNRSSVEENLPDHEMALVHGRYSKYLHSFSECFDSRNIHVDTIENLSSNPAKFLKSIARFADIDPGFYEQYEHRIYNESRALRSVIFQQMYRSTRRFFGSNLVKRKRLWSTMDRIHRKIRPVYLSLNSRRTREFFIPEDIKEILNDYYRDEEKELSRILGKPFSWKEKYIQAINYAYL